MTKLFVIVLIVTSCFLGWMHATVTLANSGYPMHGANPQRNFKANKPIRCASVAPGKTTVLSPVYQYPAINDYSFQLDSSEVTLDDQGWGYALVYSSGYYYIKRFNITDGAYYDESSVFIGPYGPKITHLAGNILYYSGSSTTNVVDTTTFNESLSYADLSDFGDQSSMAPFKNDWMVKSKIQSDLNNTDVIMYFQDSSRTIDTSFPNITADFTGTFMQDVLIYKSTTSSTEFPIVYGLPPMSGYPTVIASPTWTINLPDTFTKQVMIVGDEVVALHLTNSVGLLKFNAVTGAMTMNKTYTTWNGSSFFLRSALVYHNGKAVVQISIGATMYWVDLASGQTLVTSADFYGANRDFAFSNTDQTALSFGYSARTNWFEVTGLEWDTWKVNVRGRFPDSNDDATYGTVIIGDECRVHAVINHRFHTLAPLPIQNVIPILECVDRNTRIGYFSYNNTESKGFTIPQVDDRNNIAPGQFAPVEVFQAGRGPYFPFSYQVMLNESDSYSWTLENYVLSFTINSNIYCPDTIAIVLTLTADGTFPPGFDQIVRNTFVNVTGISDSRVTLVSKKRSVEQQSTLESELEIAPDPQNKEAPPSQVVQDFTSYQQYQFNQQIQNEPDAPANIQTSVTGKSQTNEIQGQIPPEPVAQPQSTSIPTSTPTSVPVQPPSSASRMQMTTGVVAIVLLLCFN